MCLLRGADGDRQRQPVGHVLRAQFTFHEIERKVHEEAAASCLLIGKGYAEFLQGLDVQFTDLGVVAPAPAGACPADDGAWSAVRTRWW